MKIDRETDVLLIVDFQNDFITGSLAVAGAESLIPVINSYIKKFKNIVFSRDRHKLDHPSFIGQGGPWPDHCVDNTFGMEIHSGISITGQALDKLCVDKGRDKEAYSALDGTDLADRFKVAGFRRLFICGLATDYCVKATVLNAVDKFDGKVFLLVDAIKAVNIKPDDGKEAMKEMADKGVKVSSVGMLE